jgi:nucleotide-binding universal stress UspA family protein
MYEHVLVPLDGSPAAERVLEHAEALARAFGSTVTLLRATVSAETILAETSGAETIGEIAPVMDPTPIVEADRETATDYLNGVAARLRQRKVSVNTEDPEGEPAEVIVRRAGELGASLILMTTHGRSGLGRLFFGSVADAVLRHAPCPVLLVRVTKSDDRADD